MGIQEGVEKEIDKMLKNGVIVKNEAEWASPLDPVRKKDESVRELNARTPFLVAYLN